MDNFPVASVYRCTTSTIAFSNTPRQRASFSSPPRSLRLAVVTTAVGGVPEVLPSEFVHLSPPTGEGMRVMRTMACPSLEANVCVNPV